MKTITKEHGVVMLATEVEKLCKKSYNHGLRSMGVVEYSEWLKENL